MFFTVVLAVGFAAVFLFFALRSPSPASARGKVSQLAMKYWIHIDERHGLAVERRLMTQRRWELGASGVAFGVTLIAVTESVDDQSGLVIPFVPMVVAVAVSTWAGRLVGEVFSQVSVKTTPRLARTRALRVADFVPPLLRLTLLSAALVGVGGFLWQFFSGEATRVEALVWLAPAALLLLCESCARLALLLPEPAATSSQLFLQDAMRNETIRDAYGLTAAIGAMFSVAGTIFIHPWLYYPSIFLCVVIGAVYAWRVGTRPKGDYSRMRQRLWPELSPTDVVVTGVEQSIA